jgi:orotidine-5'-phosphate decarboxylase
VPDEAAPAQPLRSAGSAGSPRPSTTTAAGGRRSFGDVLAQRVAERESQIVLGLDPDPGALWPSGHAAAKDLPADAPPAQRAAAAVLAHCRTLIDAAGPACVAVKPQLACFERLGAPGRDALGAVVEHARERGLLAIADGKRGDIDVTAQAYADALIGGIQTPFGAVPGLKADLVTVNPLMGRDAVAPFVFAARAHGAGVLALVRTSNPGAADVQDLELAGGGDLGPAGGERVWERLAALVAELGAAGVGEAGLSDVGAVVGATAPGHVARARELMPHAVLLLPGVGAQGGRVEDLAPAFAAGRAGGLIAASRSIAGAHLAAGGDPAAAARAEAERLRAAAWKLG